MEKGKKILVTGGAGFVGSHLCHRLLEEGHKVICFDNLYTGTRSNIDHLQKYPHFIYINHNIINPINIEVDEIYNLASPASPKHYQSDPIETIKTNIFGSMNMLELAKKNKAKILQASTSEVYGDPRIHPQVETYNGNVSMIGPRACYDESKRCAETLFFEYYRQYNLPIKVVRIFNTYGPKMTESDGRVVSNLIIQALKGEELTIYGDGSQTRSFCYVDDLVEGLIKMMNSPEEFVGPVNLGNPIETPVSDLAVRIISLTGSKSKIALKPLPIDDPTRRRPDITLAQSKLGWSPTIDIEEGLKKTIEYFKKII